MGFNPHQKGRNISAVDSARNIMSDQPSMQSVFNQSVRQPVSDDYGKKLANIRVGMDATDPNSSPLNLKQRLDSQVAKAIFPETTSTSTYPSPNFNTTESGDIVSNFLRPTASKVGISNKLKSSVPTTEFRQTEDVGGYVSSLRNLPKGAINTSNEYFATKITPLQPTETLAEELKNKTMTNMQENTEFPSTTSSKINSGHNLPLITDSSSRPSEVNINQDMQRINKILTTIDSKPSSAGQEVAINIRSNNDKKSVSSNPNSISDTKVKNIPARLTAVSDDKL